MQLGFDPIQDKFTTGRIMEIGCMESDVGHLGKPNACECCFHRKFVHAHRRAKDSCTNEGLTHQLKQALNSSVFSVGSMQNRIPNLNGFTALWKPSKSPGLDGVRLIDWLLSGQNSIG
jgi:hypothetical protein